MLINVKMLLHCVEHGKSFISSGPGLIMLMVRLNQVITRNIYHFVGTGPHSAVGNVSGYRCVSDCRSRGREIDPGPVPYFRGD